MRKSGTVPPVLDRSCSRRALLRGALLGAVGVGSLARDGLRAAAATTQASSHKSTRADAAVARWTPVKAAGRPPARSHHSLTLDPASGSIYLFGGRREGNALNDLWLFDPRQSSWRPVRTTGPRPAARFTPNSSWDAARGRLVIAMGQGNNDFFNDVWAFDPARRAWSKLGAAGRPRPEARYGSGSAYDRSGNRFFVSHGFRGGRFDDTWAFDLAGNSWRKIATSGRVPVKRCLIHAFWDSADKRFYLYGGQTDGTPFLGDLWSLDVARGLWREHRGRSPGPRNLYGSSFDGSARRWYVFGGNTARGPVGDTWAYDVRGDAWSRVAPGGQGPSARQAPDVALVGKTLYLFGGADDTKELDDTWMLDLSA